MNDVSRGDIYYLSRDRNTQLDVRLFRGMLCSNRNIFFIMSTIIATLIVIILLQFFSNNNSTMTMCHGGMMCVTFKECKRDKDAVLNPDDFCATDYSKICCRIENITTLSETTTIKVNVSDKTVSQSALRHLSLAPLDLTTSQKNNTQNGSNCILRDGTIGLCINATQCQRNKDVLLTPDDFCENRSKFCCHKSKVINSFHNTTETRSLTPVSFEFENYKSFKTFDLKRCGKASTTNRISGGKEANLREFPWAALISYEKSKSSEGNDFSCGGTLINGKWKTLKLNNY